MVTMACSIISASSHSARLLIARERSRKAGFRSERSVNGDVQLSITDASRQRLLPRHQAPCSASSNSSSLRSLIPKSASVPRLATRTAQQKRSLCRARVANREGATRLPLSLAVASPVLSLWDQFAAGVAGGRDGMARHVPGQSLLAVDGRRAKGDEREVV